MTDEAGSSVALAVTAVAVVLVVGASIAAPPVDAAGADAPAGTAVVHDADRSSQSDDASAERDGTDVVLSVPADAIGGGGDEATLTVAVSSPAGNDGAAPASVVAERSGDRYVATVPVADVVGPAVDADLATATVRARHDGAVVLEDEVDLRLLAPRGAATFDGATLAVPVDARGLGGANATLAVEPVDGGFASTRQLPARVVGTGSDARLLVAPEALGDLDVAATYRAAALVGGERVPGSAFEASIRDAAAAGTRIAYPDGEPVLAQPLLHPAIGPERVDLYVATSAPEGHYVRTGVADDRGFAAVPARIATARERSVTVAGDDAPLLEGVAIAVQGRDRVQMRVENGTLNVTRPDALAPYDAIVLRDGDVTHLPIDAALREDGSRELPASVLPLHEDASAILVGAGERPARGDLTVVVHEDESSVATLPEPAPDADEFVGIWIDVGDGIVLLVFGMLGGGGAVAAAFLLRLFRPASAARPGLRGVVLHFLLGGIAGVAAIATVQRLWTGPLLSTVDVAGVEVGLGALLVGSVYGGIVASAFRTGLGSAGIWPTSYVAGGPAVPVRVTVTDDAGSALPGTQTVEVQRPGTGRLLRTETVRGTSTEIELSPGEYGLVATTGERETDPRVIELPEPDRTVPEAVDVELTVSRPGLQVEVADAETGAAVDGATVRVTTDSEKTRTETAAEGSATFALPVETATVTVVVEAEGYETATVEQALDEQLRTVDVALEPLGGELVATALVDGEPTPGVTVQVAPGEDDPEAVGERSAALETGEDGRTRTRLPVGEYVARLQFGGANADLFATGTASVAVTGGGTATVEVPAQFRWTPDDDLRERAARLQRTIRSVATEATADPTIPLYFAGVAGALLDVFESLPDSGHQFATASFRPDAIARVSIDAAQATLSGVGAAMQQPAVEAVLAADDAEPERVVPELDATLPALLEYLAQDVTVGTVEARAERVRERIDREASSLATVAPVQAMVEIALQLPEGAEAPVQRAGREYAALLLLDAVEALFERDALRGRLAAAPEE